MMNNPKYKVDDDLIRAFQATMKIIMCILAPFGAVLILALLWSIPLQSGLIVGGGTAVSTPPDMSLLWSIEALPAYILCVGSLMVSLFLSASNQKNKILE